MPTLFQRLGDLRDAFYGNDVLRQSTNLDLYRYARCLEELSPSYDEFVVKSLREAADHLLFSRSIHIGSPCLRIFMDGSRRAGWTQFQHPAEDEYRLAALMLIATEQVELAHEHDWVQIEHVLCSWLGSHPELWYESRSQDLATLLFGPTWTALYSGDLADARSTADAVLLTRPTFVHHPVHKDCLDVSLPVLPSDLTI